MDVSGAGLAALRIHKSLLGLGYDSKVLVSSKTSDLDSIFVAQPNHNFYKWSSLSIFRLFQRKIVKKRGYASEIEKYEKILNAIPQKNQTAAFTFPLTYYDISEHPLVIDADIIHLHWIANFVDYKTFFKKVDKPIVWTCHDLNPLMGGFHHTYDKNNYYSFYKTVEDDFYTLKKEAIANSFNISIVALSSEMRENLESHEFFKDKHIYTIHNSVDYNKFLLKDKESCRQVLGLSHYDHIFLFVSDFLNNHTKGLTTLIKAMDKMALPNTVLICIGNGAIHNSINFDIIHFRSVYQEELLSIFYSCADVYILPSIQESFSQTTIEAMACGTPVVAFPVGIAKEIITDQNGILCFDFSVDAMIEGIRKVLLAKYEPNIIRQDIINQFSPEKICNDYVNVYNKLSRY
jgi:glycosyltransferase involved in cell wall biosynthesis